MTVRDWMLRNAKVLSAGIRKATEMCDIMYEVIER